MIWSADSLAYDQNAMLLNGYIKEDSNPCEVPKSSYQRKSLLVFLVFVKPCALLYTSLVAAIEYQKHTVGLL
jgi:hypothetical protein